MRPLELPEAPGLNLSFDFDGTLHDPSASPSVSPDLFETLVRLRDEKGALWGINTGRSMNHVIEGLIEGRFPFLPDWVVAREREIWFPNRFGRWVGDKKWNKTCEKEHKRFFKKARKVLAAIRAEVEEHTGATWVEQEGDPAGLIATSTEEMEWIVGRVRELAAGEPMLGWLRNSIYLRFGHRNYQKGSSLVQVSSGFGLGVGESFAIGDSFNDLEMLSPKVAASFACPGNAEPTIRSHVESLGGHVCARGHSDACVEALEHFFGSRA